MHSRDHNHIFICPLISREFRRELGDDLYMEIAYKSGFDYLYQYFPELMKIKPANKKIEQSWWGGDDREIRIQKLEEMIKMCEDGND